MKIAAALLWVAIAAKTILAIGDVSIDVRTPKISFAPSFLRARVTVPQNAANREICVFGVDGEFVVLSRCYSLDGEKAPRTHWFEFKRVDAGRYEVFAVLRRSLEVKYSERIPVRVLAPGESIDGGSE